MAVEFRIEGSTKKTQKFLRDMQRMNLFDDLNRLAQEGVAALAAHTPKDSGLTASSWSYDIRVERGDILVSWNNSNVNNGVNIAIILQYGHGTRNGGYVAGVDYINPAIKPIFDRIREEVWRRVVDS